MTTQWTFTSENFSFNKRESMVIKEITVTANESYLIYKWDSNFKKPLPVKQCKLPTMQGSGATKYARYKAMQEFKQALELNNTSPVGVHKGNIKRTTIPIKELLT
jgi:hypothetical protein